jgi:hypothetical protein
LIGNFQAFDAQILEDARARQRRSHQEIVITSVARNLLSLLVAGQQIPRFARDDN